MLGDELDLAELGRDPRNVNLKDATYDEIWKELRSRFPTIVVLSLANVGDDEELLHHSFDGGRYACVGMAQAFVNLVLND